MSCYIKIRERRIKKEKNSGKNERGDNKKNLEEGEGLEEGEKIKMLNININ